MTTLPPMFFFPGLAADADLFAPQHEAFASLVVPPWIAPRHPRETLEEYAARLAPTIPVPEHGPYFLGGFSFGSQVAQELVQHMPRRPAGVILICGVRSRAQFTPRFHAQQILGSLTPGFVQRLAFGPFAARFARQCGLDQAWTQRLVAMAKRNNPAFLTWSARACARWRGMPRLAFGAVGGGLHGAGLGVPVHHIHGELDQIIPDVLRQADRTIAGAGHLITWTHAREVNEFVRSCTAMQNRKLDVQ